MSLRSSPVPRSVAIYGALGVIPFWAPSAIAWARPALTGAMTFALAIYAALILSFLGGARWAFAASRPRPSVVVVSLAMLPTLVGFGLLLAPASVGWLRLPGLAAALAVMGLWDLRPDDAPAWYPRLRGFLTLGAVGGVVVGAPRALVHGGEGDHRQIGGKAAIVEFHRRLLRTLSIGSARLSSHEM